MPINYGSVCSSFETATQAWHPQGMRDAWCAEIEPLPSAIQAYQYPDVPNQGDMTKFQHSPYSTTGYGSARTPHGNSKRNA